MSLTNYQPPNHNSREDPLPLDLIQADPSSPPVLPGYEERERQTEREREREREREGEIYVG